MRFNWADIALVFVTGLVFGAFIMALVWVGWSG